MLQKSAGCFSLIASSSRFYRTTCGGFVQQFCNMHSLSDSELKAERALGAHYQRFAETTGSILAGAWIRPDLMDPTQSQIFMRRVQKDFNLGKSKAYLQTFQFDHNKRIVIGNTPSIPFDSVVSLYSVSPSGRFTFLARTEAAEGNGPKSTTFTIQCAKTGVHLRSITIDAKAHGDIISDGWFGEGVSWSHDEQHIIYVAEALSPSADAVSFYTGVQPQDLMKENDSKEKSEKPSAESPTEAIKKKQEAKKKGIPPGRQFDWEAGGKEDFGEKYVGVRQPRLFVVNWPLGLMKPVPGIPDTIAAGQPVFVPPSVTSNVGSIDDSTHPPQWITYTGWNCKDRRLGMIYCYNRPCGLFTVNIADLFKPKEQIVANSEREKKQDQTDSVHFPLTPSWPVARSGRFVKDMNNETVLVCLGMSGIATFTHNGGSSLLKIPIENWYKALSSDSTVDNTTPPTIQELVPTVYDPWNKEASSDWFPGLYMDGLPVNSMDGKGNLYAISSVGSKESLLCIEIASGVVEPVTLENLSELFSEETKLFVGGPASEISYHLFQVFPANSHRQSAHVLVGITTPAQPMVLILLEMTSKTTAKGFLLNHSFLSSPILPFLPVHGATPSTTPIPLGKEDGESSNEVARTLQQYLASQYPSNRNSLVSDLEAMRSIHENLRWKVLPVFPPDHSVPGPFSDVEQHPFESIVVYHEKALQLAKEKNEALPLLIVPHGGPHGCLPTFYIQSHVYLASLGYVVLMVNYRGSTGFGEGPLGYLPGRSGITDTLDMEQAAMQLLGLSGWEPALPWLSKRNREIVEAAKKAAGSDQDFVAPKKHHLLWTPEDMGLSLASLTSLRLNGNRVAVAGGSHGGFLSCHLTSGVLSTSTLTPTSEKAETPFHLRAAIIRNPVTNISTMCGSTDIPDWCWTEAIGLGSWPAPSLSHPMVAYKQTNTAKDGSQFNPMERVDLKEVKVQGAVPRITPKSIAQMLECSPMNRLEGVKIGTGGRAVDQNGGSDPTGTAVFLLIGMKDRRVPPPQGLEWYNAVKSQEVEREKSESDRSNNWRDRLRMVTFPEDVHALDRIPTEGNTWPNVASWLARFV